MPIKTGSFALLLLAAAFSAGAGQVYKWVDAEGRIHYSDTPRPGWKRVDLKVAPGFAPATAQTPAAQSGAEGGESPERAKLRAEEIAAAKEAAAKKADGKQAKGTREECDALSKVVALLCTKKKAHKGLKDELDQKTRDELLKNLTNVKPESLEGKRKLIELRGPLRVRVRILHRHAG